MHDRRLDQGAPLRGRLGGNELRTAEDLLRAADRGRLALAHHHDRGGEARDLGQRVRHVDDRNARLVAQPLDERQDLGLARVVERGERLVHQQQAGRGQERTPERDPLLLAAGERSGMAVEQAPDPEQVDHGGELHAALAARHEPAAEQQVLPHRQVREQPSFLEHVADAPAVPGHEHAARGVDQRRAVDHDATALGAQKSGDDVDQRALAGAGAAEQRGQPSRRHEAGIEGECSQPMGDADLEAHSDHDRWPTRRAISSDMSSAPIEIAIETRVRRSAPASPPGIWVKV